MFGTPNPSNRSDGALPPSPATATHTSRALPSDSWSQQLSVLQGQHNLKPWQVEAFQSFFADLEDLCRGGEPRDGLEKRAASVFSELLHFQALLLLAEVCNVFNEAMAPWPGPDGTPRLSSLALRVRSDWQPWGAHTGDSLQALFRQIRAQRVTVESLDNAALPLPEAMNAVLAGLLEAGTTQLHIVSPLTAPTEIDFWATSPLASITLGASAPGDSAPMPLSGDAIDNFRVVLRELATCRSLKHLALEHPDLLCLHDVVRDFIKPTDNAAVLTSLAFRHGADADKTSMGTDLPKLIETARLIPSLQTIEVNIPWLVPGDVDEVLLSPLKGHTNLIELVFNGGLPAPSQKGMHLQPQIVSLAEECPSLKTVHLGFRVTSPLLFNVNGMELLRQQGLDLDPPEAASAMQANFASKKKIALETVVIHHAFLPSNPLHQWAQETHPRALSRPSRPLTCGVASAI